MGIASDLKSVASELFRQFSGDITIISEGTATQDAWGEFTNSGQTSTTAKAIVDSYNEYTRVFTNGASLSGGDIVFILKGDETFTMGSSIVYNNQTFKIQTINPIHVEGETIVYLVPSSLI